ncbi:MAG: tripartite tricarboxylate transporter TctB family protein [Syntrophales bacterium]
MNNEKYLSIFFILIGALGVYGSLKVPIAERFTLGPGAAPLIYSVGVLCFAIALLVIAFRGHKDKILNVIPTIPPKYGLLFFLFNCALALSVHLIGFTAGLFLFSFSSLIYIDGWKIKKALLFSVLWTIVLYVLFKFIIGVPFIEGFLFENK